MMENFYRQLENIKSKYQDKDKIYIIGKGSSINEIYQWELEDGIIINVQDSEKLINGNISIVSSSWAWGSICKVLRADLYISYENPLELANFAFLNYKGNNYEEAINEQDPVICDYLFVTATQIAEILCKDKHREVYYLGFDFFETAKPDGEYSPHSTEFNNKFLEMQRSLFKHMLEKYKSNKQVTLKHVGNYEFSDKTHSFAFNEVTKGSSCNVDNSNSLYNDLKLKMENGHVIVVSEFTNNHIGDPHRIREMVRLSVEAGADIIKVQKRNVETFYTEEQLASKYSSPFGDTLKDYRSNVELTDETFRVLIEACNEYKIPWFASILDYESFKYMLKFNPMILKLPSTISNHRNYLTQVAKEFTGDIVVSTGFTDVDYEKFVLDTFTSNERSLYLLQCTSSYPAPADACQIGVVRHYDHVSKSSDASIVPGYSSHDFGSLGCQMAVAAGAKMVEKHVKLGNLDWVHFDGVAIDLTDGSFKKFVDDIRLAQTMTGSGTKKIHSTEHHKYKPNETSN